MRRPLAAALVLAVAAAACRSRAPAPSGAEPFTIVVPYEVTALDPHLENSVSNFAVLSNVYEPLVITDPDMRVQPALAVGWESPDPLTWLLRLRPGVTFHSGHALTARDVVYSLERLRTDVTLDMGSFLHDIASAEAVDAHTVRVRTTRPVRVLLSKLHFALVVPDGATTASLDRTPDGTGPYRLVRWERDRSVTLQRFDGHWRGGAPLREVRLVQAVSPRAAIEALDGPGAGLVQGQSKELERKARGDARFEVAVRDNIYVKFLGYDLARPETPYASVKPNPFLEARVREAVDLALDRDALTSALSAAATPATQPVPRFIFGYDPALPGSRADPARARALLQAAGLGAGFEVTLHTRTLLAEGARLVAAQLAAVGIRVRVEVLAEGEFFARHQKADATFWLNRFGCPTGDASDFLDSVIHSRDPARRYGVANYGGFSDPALDRAIETSVEVDRVDARRAALQSILRAVMERRVVLPLYVDQDVYAVDRRFTWRPRNDSYVRVAEIRRR